MTLKAMMPSLMKDIHGNMPLEDLIPTNVEHIYKTTRPLFPYVYLNGYYYAELHPDALYAFGVDAPEYQHVFDQMKTEASNPLSPWNVDWVGGLAKVTKEFNAIVDRHRGWVTLMSRIDKKIGLSIYLRDFDKIPDEDKYDAFIAIYTRSEYGFEILSDKYTEIFSYAEKSLDRLDRLLVLNLKYEGKITIYHGAKPDADPENPHDYYSWTLRKEVAEMFAYRYGTSGEVWERIIDVSEAIDYLEDRDEDEILYNYPIKK